MFLKQGLDSQVGKLKSSCFGKAEEGELRRMALRLQPVRES